MAASIGSNYNPASVMLGSKAGGPYLPSKPVMQGPAQPASTTLGPQSVRATGSGPFDSAYRQNLATYSGGLFQRPGGNLSFNPTDPGSFPGQATGGGTAPLPGMPTSLSTLALGGQPYSTPVASPSTSNTINQQGNNNWWMQQFLGQGSAFGQPVRPTNAPNQY